MKLELGSGYAPTPGYFHLDANPSLPANSWPGDGCQRRDPHVDIRGDATALDLPDECMDEIRAVDVLEHISYRDTDKALAEWTRVLKPGGRLYVQVPDVGHVLRDWEAAMRVGTPESFGGIRHLSERIPVDLVTGVRGIDAWNGLQWRLLGGHEDEAVVGEGDWRFNAHYALFTDETLTWHLERASLSIVEFGHNAHPNIQCTAIKP